MAVCAMRRDGATESTLGRKKEKKIFVCIAKHGET